MAAGFPTSRNWIRLRQDLYEQVQEHVRVLLGQSSAGLRKYQMEYEKEFRRAWKVSSRESLAEALKKARIIWMGDFHALQQSQKAQVRVMKMFPEPQRLLIGVECVEARHQRALDRYIQGKISEREFLKTMEWKRSWGFPWEHYKRIFRWAQKNKVRVFALNLRTSDQSARSLKERDAFSGQKITEIAEKFPHHQFLVLYGDLHLAQRHLPAVVKRKIPEDQFLFIFQNPERIYFQLLRKEIEHQVDVVKLSRHHYCLVNVPPWVKWQNYLLYLEEHYDQAFDEELDLTDYVARYVKIISEDLGISVPVDGFSIFTANDRSAWQHLQKNLKKEELQGLASWIEDGRSFFIPQNGSGYLGRASVNSAAQLAMAIVFATHSQQKKLPLHLPQDFLRLIWLESVEYFGSKLINPKRKSDTLNDLKASLQVRSPMDRGKEALQLALHQKMLELLHLSGAQKSRELPIPSKKKSYFEAARILGGMLGEKLYYGYRRKLVSKTSLISLLKRSIDGEQFPVAYWEILELIESFPEPFQSKSEKM